MTFKFRSALLAAFVFGGAQAHAQSSVTGTANVTCTEASIGNNKKELTCTFAPVKLIVPSSLSLPGSANGNSFDLTASSSFSCAPTASAVPSGSVQTSNLAANCTGAAAPGDITWAATSSTAGAAVSLQIANPKATTTTASLNFPSTTNALALTLTACQSVGVGCQSYSTSIANSTAIVTPTGCQLTGAPTSSVAIAASVNLGVSSCQGLQAGATYDWLYNNASVGSATTLSHVPFPTGGTATSGVYLLRVCNPGGTVSAGCMSVPNANGLTVTRTAQSGGSELSLCDQQFGTGAVTIQGTMNFGTENIKGFQGYTSNGNVPAVYRVIVPNPTPANDVSARIVWNSSIGASTTKVVKISRDQACGTVGANTLGDLFDAGGKAVRYSTSATTPPYFDAGSTWYVMISSPGCTDNCNFNLEFYR